MLVRNSSIRYNKFDINQIEISHYILDESWDCQNPSKIPYVMRCECHLLCYLQRTNCWITMRGRGIIILVRYYDGHKY